MFFGIGAYGIAISANTWSPTWGSIGAGFALSLVLTLGLSLLIGLFSLRVRAIFFAMITLAVAAAFQTFRLRGGGHARALAALQRPRYLAEL